MYSMQRGDVFYADLNPVQGSEQGGEIRPVVVIQNDIGNRYSPTVIIAAVTNSKKTDLPIHVNIKNIDFLKDESIVLLEQIRTIDRCRLREYIGHLSNKYMKKIDKALAISIGLNKNFCRNK